MASEATPKRAEAVTPSPESAVSLPSHVAKLLQVERELRENERRLSAILAHSPNLVFLKDLNRRYLYVNQEFERVLHVSQEQIRGKTNDEIFPQQQAATFQAHDLQVLQAGVSMEFEEV